MTALALACLLSAGPAAQAVEVDAAVPVNPNRSAYFGDLHLHTSNSSDAAWGGVRTTREDAYRYAQGYPVTYLGHEVRRKAPLDFLAITDHAEYMGVAIAIIRKDGPFADTDWPAQMFDPEGNPGDGFLKILRSGFFGPEVFRELNTRFIKEVNWQAVIDAAEAFNQPGRFTTFAAFEWSDTPGGSHFHRVVVFPGPRYPEVPFSALDSRHPEDLWRYADNNRAQGIDSVLIPHNPNLSGGLQFAYTDSRGVVIDREFAETKARNEPLVEVTQIKGTSETHPELSPDDEFADFEILEHYLKGERQSPNGSYVRQAYGRGMEIAARVGANPYRFGLVGSSDFHSATSATEEDNYTGALGFGDSPFGVENAKRVLTAVNPVINQPIAALSASGVTGVWAEQNTREAIFAALKRREAYATSGPRIQVRLFAGWDYPAGLVDRHDWVAQAYAGGVPMGGELAVGAHRRSPRFLVAALKDPDGANLDRVQLVKVWTRDGASHERIFDVAWSDGRARDPQTGRLPEVGDTVDVASASYSNTIGSALLSAEWTDPEFDPQAAAVYYARVIEIPTPRWSTYLAVRNHLPVPDTVPATLRERAWTSPVFVDP